MRRECEFLCIWDELAAFTDTRFIAFPARNALIANSWCQGYRSVYASTNKANGIQFLDFRAIANTSAAKDTVRRLFALVQWKSRFLHSIFLRQTDKSTNRRQR